MIKQEKYALLNYGPVAQFITYWGALSWGYLIYKSVKRVRNNGIHGT